MAPRSNGVPRRGFQALLLVSVLALVAMAPETVEAQGAAPDIALSPAGGTIGVTWSGTSSANRHRVQWKSGSESYDSSRQKESNNSRGTFINELTGGVEYTVRVQARFGSTWGDWSAEKSARVLHPQLGKVPNLRVSGVAGNMIWSWGAVTNAAQYRFQWKAPGEDWSSSRQRDYGSSTTRVNDRRSGIFTPGLTYTFRVRALRDHVALQSRWSDEFQLLVGAQTPQQVDPPTVTAQPGALEVSWPAGNDVTSYLLQWKSGDESYDEGRQITVPGTDTSATIGNLAEGTVYSVRVIATREHASTNAPPSMEIMGTPLEIRTGTVSETALTVSEPDVAATYTLVLDSMPTGDVTITLTSTDMNVATVSPATLAFTTSNWNTARTVTVTGVDDTNDNPGDRRARITHAAAGGGYDNAMIGDVTVTVTDNTVTDNKGIERRDAELVLAGAVRGLTSDAVGVLAGRFDAPSSPGAQMTLAGHVLRLDPQGAQESDAWRRMPVHGDAAWWDDRQQTATALSAHDLLTRSSFVLALGDGEGGEGLDGLTLWGRGSVSGFSSSPETGGDMDGSFRSGWLGLDYRVEPELLVGMALTHGTGTVDHERTGGADAETDITLTSVAPYAHMEVEPGLELWGLLGMGRGDMEVTVAGTSAARTTDLSSFMGAVGGRQALSSVDGIDLAARADAFASTLRSESTATLPGTRGNAQRVRLLLEGSTLWTEDADTRAVPRFTLGARWDGGTADTGVGLEIGGGIAWTQAQTGLRVDLQGRYLLAHTADGYEDWGASLDLRLDPGGDGHGFLFGLSPVLGDAASGAGRLHGDADMAGLAANDNRSGRLEAELAYGVAGFDGTGTVTPYGGLTLDGTDAARYRLGSRVALGSSLDLSVEGHRTEQDGETASHGLSAQLGLRW